MNKSALGGRVQRNYSNKPNNLHCHSTKGTHVLAQTRKTLDAYRVTTWHNRVWLLVIHIVALEA